MTNTLIFSYTKIGKNRYLRELKIQGEPNLMVINYLQFGVCENPKKDFNKFKDKINKVKLEKII